MRYLRFGSRKEKKSDKMEQQEDMEHIDTDKSGIIEPEATGIPDKTGADGTPTGFSDQQMNQATKLVVKNVMEILQPLLDKLGEAVAQQKEEANAAGQSMSLEDQLKKLKEASAQRVAMQEQKIALRMQQLQARIYGG